MRNIIRREEDINLTSMIDITFLLLIFFMLLPFKTNEGKMDMQLPSNLGPGPSLLQKTDDLEDVRLFFRSNDQGKTVSVAVDQKWVARDIPTDQLDVQDNDSRYDGSRLDFQLSTIRAAFSRVDRLLQKKMKERPVTIDADREVPYLFITHAQASCKGAGFKKVRFSAPKRRLGEDEWK